MFLFSLLFWLLACAFAALRVGSLKETQQRSSLHVPSSDGRKSTAERRVSVLVACMRIVHATVCEHMRTCMPCRVSSCYRHVGDCLGQYCIEFEKEDTAATTPSEGERKEGGTAHTATLDTHQNSKACAAALVNACLASSDEKLHTYVVDWIASHGGSEAEAAPKKTQLQRACLALHAQLLLAVFNVLLFHF